MPIDLYTGQPGNGKTASMMVRLMEEVEKGERLVYASGIDGLNVPGVLDLPDPRRWNDKTPTGEYLVPDGAIIFVDEAWKHFGHLQDAKCAPNPPHVLALAEHRHRGIDFVWTTQMPNQLFPFARGLIGSHTHVVRRYGTHFIDLFTWGELQEDVKSAAKRELAQRKTTTLPAATFDKYKSATLHTIKRRIPIKIIAFPLVIVAAIVVGYLAYQRMKPDALTARLTGQESSAAQAALTPSGSGNSGKVIYRTAAEYAIAFTPRIKQMPWTAPGFDGRPVVAEPSVFCSVAGAGETATGYESQETCHCLTEQGTKFLLDDLECRTLAREGAPYNPFKAPLRGEQRSMSSEVSEGGAGASPAAMAAPAAASVSRGVGDAVEQQTAYGAFRGEAARSAH